MATNPPTGDGDRNGEVRKRSQVKSPLSGNETKRDSTTGEFMAQKKGGKFTRSIGYSVRHASGTLSGITPECCPPSVRNAVRLGADYAA